MQGIRRKKRFKKKKNGALKTVFESQSLTFDSYNCGLYYTGSHDFIKYIILSTY